MSVRFHKKVSSGFPLFFLDSKAGKFVLLEPKVRTQPGQLIELGKIHGALNTDKRTKMGYQRVYGAVHGNNAWIPLEWVEKYTIDAAPGEMHSDNAEKSFLIIDQPNMKQVQLNDAGTEKAASILDTATKAINSVVDTATNVAAAASKNTKEGVTEPTTTKTLTVQVPAIFKATPFLGLAAGIGYAFYEKKTDWKSLAIHGLAGFGIGSAPLAVYALIPGKK